MMDSQLKFSRKAFILGSLTAGAGCLTALRSFGALADKVAGGAPGASVKEEAREVPVAGEFDVIVCGGGPAGIAAAIAAGRTGARVLLLELHNCLGGIWTAGCLPWILDTDQKAGLLPEIMAGLRREGLQKIDSRGNPSWGGDIEGLKLLLETLCAQAGVRVRYQTAVVAARRGGGNRLTHVVTESKSGRQAWSARVFIDCTGDGDLAAQAGCGFDLGRPQDGKGQPMSLIALVGGVDFNEMLPFRSGDPAQPWKAGKEALREVMERHGVSPSYGHPSLFHMHGGLYFLMANQEYGVNPLDADAITAATIHARGDVARMVGALREDGGVWKNIQLVATASQIGVREARRIHGRYTVTQEDVAKGARQRDAVCRAKFGTDVHSVDPKATKGIEAKVIQAVPYDIPLRALIARDVEGLLMAGRCISGDFLAHASYRVTGNAVALGEGAGVCAAMAAKKGGLPQEVPVDDFMRELARFRQG